jgi:hypothetical protein
MAIFPGRSLRRIGWKGLPMRYFLMAERYGFNSISAEKAAMKTVCHPPMRAESR